MTFYILMQTVQHEGSSLKGTFASLEDALDHIDQMDGYCMAGWTCDRDDVDPMFEDDWTLECVQNATGGWYINGPADLSFSVFSCSLGGE